MDEFISANNINKTQMYLRVGHISAGITAPHTAAIRGYFSVTTPTCISSIRGSKMDVVYDDILNKTTITVLEDEAFVKGVLDNSELTVPLNKKVVVDSTGKATLSNNTTANLSNGTGTPMNVSCCGPTVIFLFLLSCVILRN